MLCDHQMDFETVEKAFLAGLIAAPFFAAIEMAATNAVVVAGGDRKAVQHIQRMGIQLFPSLSQQTEQDQEQVSHAVKTTVEAALAQHLGHVAIFPPKYSAAVMAVVITSASLTWLCGSS